MKSKITTFLSILLLAVVFPTGIILAHSGSGSGGGDERVRIEVRAGEGNEEENRVRVELRGAEATTEEALNLMEGLNLPDEIGRVRIEQRDDRVRVKVRALEAGEVPDVDIEGNTFEITGEVTAFTGGTVTIAGRTITINPALVANFEQEGIIEAGEVIKIEGITSGETLLAREIKANGLEVETVDTTSIFTQILAFLRNLMQT